MIEAAFKAATRNGLQPSEFWRSTPYLTALLSEGRAEELDRERREMLWHAWHIEAFARTKHLPNLKTMLSGPVKKRIKTPEDIDAILFSASPRSK